MKKVLLLILTLHLVIYSQAQKFTSEKSEISFFSDAAMVKAMGKLTIHGVTRDVNLPGTLEFAGSKTILKSKFIVKLKDYDIKIPKLVWQNIAEEIEVNVEFIYKPV